MEFGIRDTENACSHALRSLPFTLCVCASLPPYFGGVLVGTAAGGFEGAEPRALAAGPLVAST